MDTREDLGSSPSGQVLVGFFGSSDSSPGCWIARKRVLPSGVKAGQVFAQHYQPCMTTGHEPNADGWFV